MNIKNYLTFQSNLIKIQEPLGRGGFGIVEAGEYKNLRLAIKKVSIKGDYEKEINTLQLIRSINTPLFYGMFLSEMYSHIIIEKINGLTLEDLILLLKSLSSNEFLIKKYSITENEIYLYKLIISYNLVKSIEFLHLNGIIHRDIKPNNIMIDCKHNIKMLDFGISKNNKNNSISISNPRIGTLIYLSPEFYLSHTKSRNMNMEYSNADDYYYDNENSCSIDYCIDNYNTSDISNVMNNQKVRISYKSDIWALGLVLNELFSYEKPWENYIQFSQFEVVGLIYSQKNFPISEKIPMEVKDIIEKSTKYNKDDRWNATKIKDSFLFLIYRHSSQAIHSLKFNFIDYLFFNKKPTQSNSEISKMKMNFFLIFQKNLLDLKTLILNQHDKKKSPDWLSTNTNSKVKLKWMEEETRNAYKSNYNSDLINNVNHNNSFYLSNINNLRLSYESYINSNNNKNPIIDNSLNRLYKYNSSSKKQKMEKKEIAKEEVHQMIFINMKEKGKYIVYLSKTSKKTIFILSLSSNITQIKSEFIINRIWYLSHYHDKDNFICLHMKHIYIFQLKKTKYIKRLFISGSDNNNEHEEYDIIEYFPPSSTIFSMNLLLIKLISNYNSFLLFYSLDDEKLIKSIEINNESIKYQIKYLYTQFSKDNIVSSINDSMMRRINLNFYCIFRKNPYSSYIFTHSKHCSILFSESISIISYSLVEVYSQVLLISSLNLSSKCKYIEIRNIENDFIILKHDLNQSALIVEPMINSSFLFLNLTFKEKSLVYVFSVEEINNSNCNYSNSKSNSCSKSNTNDYIDSIYNTYNLDYSSPGQSFPFPFTKSKSTSIQKSSNINSSFSNRSSYISNISNINNISILSTYVYVDNSYDIYSLLLNKRLIKNKEKSQLNIQFIYINEFSYDNQVNSINHIKKNHFPTDQLIYPRLVLLSHEYESEKVNRLISICFYYVCPKKKGYFIYYEDE